MREIRNPDGYLTAKYSPQTGVVEIKNKQWITLIEIDPNGNLRVTHVKI